MSFSVLFSLFYDVLNPVFLHIAIDSLCFIDAHRLHPLHNWLVILFVFLLNPPLSFSSLPTFALIFLFLKWKIDWDLSILLFPLFTIVSWVGVLLLWVWILRVKLIISVHHELKKLSFFRVLLFLEDDIAEQSKAFLYLCIFYWFLQIVFN